MPDNDRKLDNVREPYLLRVRKGSPLDKVMVALSQRACSREELEQIGGQTQWGYRLQRLAPVLDNVAIVRNGELDKLSYVHPNGNVPVPVNVQVTAPVDANPVTMEKVRAAFDQQQDINQISVRWPDPPPFIQSMGDAFRQPSWFNTMREMVRHGRHIALEGPPSVGKDTAVQELAAQEGKILVTVGGDAGFRRRDLVGQAQIAGGRSFLDVAEYAAAVVNGWWVSLTEVNAADADALIFINAQLAAPYIINIAGKAYPVHPDFRLFVTYNAGLTGTKPLPQSFKDRFFSIKVPFPSYSQLKSLLIAHGAYDDEFTDGITKYGITLWGAHERGQLRYQVTLRRLMDAVELLQLGIVPDVREALKQAVIAAIDSPVEANVAKQVMDQAGLP